MFTVHTVRWITMCTPSFSRVNHKFNSIKGNYYFKLVSHVWISPYTLTCTELHAPSLASPARYAPDTMYICVYREKHEQNHQPMLHEVRDTTVIHLNLHTLCLYVRGAPLHHGCLLPPLRIWKLQVHGWYLLSPCVGCCAQVQC